MVLPSQIFTDPFNEMNDVRYVLTLTANTDDVVFIGAALATLVVLRRQR